MAPLLEPGSPEEMAVKPPRPFCPRPSALLSGLSVAAFGPAATDLFLSAQSSYKCRQQKKV